MPAGALCDETSLSCRGGRTRPNRTPGEGSAVQRSAVQVRDAAQLRDANPHHNSVCPSLAGRKCYRGWRDGVAAGAPRTNNAFPSARFRRVSALRALIGLGRTPMIQHPISQVVASSASWSPRADGSWQAGIIAAAPTAADT